jgi:hypothetical protein
MPPARAPRGSWPVAFGWYFAGVFVSLGAWSTFGLLGRFTYGALGSLASLGVGSAVAVLLIGRGQSMARRSRVAFVFGVMTPFVVIAAAFACLAYAFAHSDWQF